MSEFYMTEVRTYEVGKSFVYLAFGEVPGMNLVDNLDDNPNVAI